MCIRAVGAVIAALLCGEIGHAVSSSGSLSCVRPKPLLIGNALLPSAGHTARLRVVEVPLLPRKVDLIIGRYVFYGLPERYSSWFRPGDEREYECLVVGRTMPPPLRRARLAREPISSWIHDHDHDLDLGRERASKTRPEEARRE